MRSLGGEYAPDPCESRQLSCLHAAREDHPPGNVKSHTADRERRFPGARRHTHWELIRPAQVLEQRSTHEAPGRRPRTRRLANCSSRSITASRPALAPPRGSVLPHLPCTAASTSGAQARSADFEDGDLRTAAHRRHRARMRAGRPNGRSSARSTSHPGQRGSRNGSSARGRPGGANRAHTGGKSRCDGAVRAAPAPAHSSSYLRQCAR